MAPTPPEQHVRVLDEDPDLAERIPEDRRRRAVETLVVPLLHVRPGRWDPLVEEPDGACMGLLVLRGNLLPTFEVGERRASVVVGPGEILQPWSASSVWRQRHTALLRALSPVDMAVLDRAFIQRLAEFPELAGALMERLIRSTREMVLSLAIASNTRVDVRLHLMLWQMAAKWGKMRPDGVLLPIKLTHTTMAELVGSRRPTITTALADLAGRGLVTRVEDGWLLTGEPPDDVFAT